MFAWVLYLSERGSASKRIKQQAKRWLQNQSVESETDSRSDRIKALIAKFLDLISQVTTRIISCEGGDIYE